jgi:hypothetical protein
VGGNDNLKGTTGTLEMKIAGNQKGREKERNKDLRRGSNRATSLLALVFKHGPTNSQYYLDALDCTERLLRQPNQTRLELANACEIVMFVDVR